MKSYSALVLLLSVAGARADAASGCDQGTCPDLDASFDALCNAAGCSFRVSDSYCRLNKRDDTCGRSDFATDLKPCGRVTTCAGIPVEICLDDRTNRMLTLTWPSGQIQSYQASYSIPCGGCEGMYSVFDAF